MLFQSFFVCLISTALVRQFSSYGLVVASDQTDFSKKCLALRGGRDKIDVAKEHMQLFLNTPDGVNNGGEFFIQGWRWHTMSLTREAKRLQKVAEKMREVLINPTFSEDKSQETIDLKSLKEAADYVVGFNMKGLHKVEKELFFPWARKKVNAIKNPSVGEAFGTLMDCLDRDRQSIASLGKDLTEISSVAADLSIDNKARTNALTELAEKSAAIASGAKCMLELEDNFLVPTIARIVSASEQKAFNDKVIRNLGLLDSRLHLVGMHEAVWELKDEKEQQLFHKTIPSIPRMMIPRWKRLLYEPQTLILNQACQ